MLLGATLLAGGVSLAAPLQGGADSATGTATSTVTLTSSQSTCAYGEQLVLTATVIPTAEGAAPDGSVTFTDSGADLGTVALNSSGQAALADSDLSAGTHSLEAEYSGSATYASANSNPLAQVITVQGSSTSLFAAPDPTGYGDTVVAVATVLPAAGGGVPTGTVALMNGKVSVATAPLSDGVAVFAVSTLDAGSDSLTAAYAGDGNFATSTSPALSQEVDPATTTTTLTVSPNPAQTGAAVTLTATVASGAAVPDGEVSFSASGTSLGTGALSGGSATLTVTFDRTGSQRLVATYAGDDNFDGSQSQPVRLSVHPAPRCHGDGDGDGDDPPAGGTASCCSHSGGGGDGSGTDGCRGGPTASPQIADAVLSASIVQSPQVTVSAFPSSVNQGQSITLTSLILGGSGDVDPSGTVTWVQGSKVLGSAQTAGIGSSGDAVASLRTLLAAGRYGAVAAKYAPDQSASGTYSAAKSGTTAAVAVARVAATTTLTLASSQNPLPAGGSAIFTATVNHPLSSLAATGTVTFTVGESETASASLDSLGQATVDAAHLSAGSYTVTASYSGDDAFASAQTSTRESVLAVVVPPPHSTPSPSGSGSPTAVATPVPSGGHAKAPSGRPSGGSGSTPPKPGAAPATPGPLDLGAAPPVGLISLVAGIQLGGAPQIIVFLIIANGLLAVAILLASRRGRRLTRRSLEWEDVQGAGEEAD